MTTDLVHGGDADRFGGWKWAKRFRGEHFRRCSYCGTLHPEDLVAEPGWTAEWSDMKYGWPHKFYVDVPNRNPDELVVVGTTNSDASPGPGWSRWSDLTRKQRRAAARDGHHRPAPTHVLMGTRPSHHGKFYSVHLADPTLDPQVKKEIERVCGLRFTFQDGSVRWERFVEAAR